jgi:LEA14-like dessication related protein
VSRAAGLCLLAAAMSLGPGGCRTVEGLTTRPAVRSVAVTVTHADLRAIHLRFDVDLLNPGDGEMRVKGYDYELQIEGRPFAAGASQEGFVLAPRGTARAAVPVVLALAELQRAMAAFKRQGEAAYRLAVTLLIDTPLGDIRFPLTKEGCLRAFPPAVRSCPGRS